MAVLHRSNALVKQDNDRQHTVYLFVCKSSISIIRIPRFPQSKIISKRLAPINFKRVQFFLAIASEIRSVCPPLSQSLHFAKSKLDYQCKGNRYGMQQHFVQRTWNEKIRTPCARLQAIFQGLQLHQNTWEYNINSLIMNSYQRWIDRMNQLRVLYSDKAITVN
jgi:hypothetical protein